MLRFFKKLKLDIYFFLLEFIFVIAFLIGSSDYFSFYRAYTTVTLFPSRSDFPTQTATENLAKLAGTLFLREKMTEEYPETKENWEKYSSDEQKKLWNKKMKATEKGINLEISVTDKKADRATLLSRRTAATLIEVATRYYDPKKELTLRITDAAIVAKENRWNNWLIFSFLGGTSVALAVQFLLVALENFLRRKTFIRKKTLDFHFAFPKIPLSREDARHVLAKKIEKEISIPASFPATEKKNFSVSKKASPPSNLPIGLPIGEEIFLPDEETSPALDIQAPMISAENTEHKEHKEPSKEEIKKRLNQLLRGEL